MEKRPGGKIMKQSQATNKTGGGYIYTICKDGVICAASNIPGCGYSTQELKELRAAGFEILEYGRKVKKGKE